MIELHVFHVPLGEVARAALVSSSPFFVFFFIEFCECLIQAIGDEDEGEFRPVVWLDCSALFVADRSVDTCVHEVGLFSIVIAVGAEEVASSVLFD